MTKKEIVNKVLKVGIVKVKFDGEWIYICKDNQRAPADSLIVYIFEVEDFEDIKKLFKRKILFFKVFGNTIMRRSKGEDSNNRVYGISRNNVDLTKRSRRNGTYRTNSLF